MYTGREGGGAKVKVLPNKDNKGCQKGARVSRFITLDIIMSYKITLILCMWFLMLWWVFWVSTREN
jgi:hypothetical protein